MKKKFFIFNVCLFGISLFAVAGEKEVASFEVRDLLEYVDVTLGVDPGVGKCTPGVSLPFGFIRPSAHTPDAPHTGYNRNKEISGFTLVNLGSPYKGGNILISPQTGIDPWDDNAPTTHDSPKANETHSPDYYSVDLTKFGIKTEFTSASRTSLFRITYPENSNAAVVIYPSHTLWAKSTVSASHYDPEKNLLTGWFVNNDGWYYAHGYKTYFAIQFSQPLIDYGTYSNNDRRLSPGTKDAEGDGAGFYLRINALENTQLFIKASVSQRSIENAVAFMKKEIPAWDFETVRLQAATAWNKALSSILIDDETISDDERTLFYT